MNVVGSVQKITDVEEIPVERFRVGIDSLDRLFGTTKLYVNGRHVSDVHGMARGKLYLLGGGEGVGKTKLWTALMTKIAAEQRLRSMIYQGEMLAGEYKALCMQMWRAMPIAPQNLDCISVVDRNVRTGEMLAERVREYKPDLLIVDSLATLEGCETKAGVDEFVFRMKEVMGNRTAGVFITHLDKKGNIGGLRRVSYMFDTVLHLQKEKQIGFFSMSVPGKNRGGSTGGKVTFKHNGDLIELVL